MPYSQQDGKTEGITVSVVVPCYNSMKTLGDCLRSLESQQFPRESYEIIVADNGSRDGSPQFIAKNYPAVIVVEATQKGSGYARNAGIQRARGELILSTDADCVADPLWMATMVAMYDDAPEDTAAIGGAIVPFSEKTRVERHKQAWITQPLEKDPASRIRYTATPNAAFRASALREVGAFDGTLGFDDTDLGIRLEAAGYKILYTEAAIVRHRNPVTLRELYRHRLKYGEFGFTIARKHPALYGDPSGRKKRRVLLRETAWRVIKDAIKLPLSLLPSRRKRPIGWPIIDAAMAWGNYRGFRRASLAWDAAFTKR